MTDTTALKLATQGRGLRAFGLAASVPWAIRPDALEVILRLAARDDITREDVAAAMVGTPEALSARLGRPLDNAHAVEMHGNVAVIPVNGPIFRYASLFSEISGATSAEMLARDLQAAVDDPSVQGILLEVDSPGGEVAGTAELAGMIRAASERKPVHAYIDDLGASAAYWLSAAAGHITASSTAIVGSIGVVSAMPDPTKTNSKDIEFVSSKSPKKRANIATEAGRAQVQAVVDAIADVFIADVARYRGVSPDTVEAEFGQGDVFVGQAAVAAGLVNAIGTFEEALAGVAIAAQQRGGRTAHTGRTAVGMRDKFFAWLDGMDAPASADQEAAIVTENLNRPADPSSAPAAAASSAATTDTTALTERMTAMEAELKAAKSLTESQAVAIKGLSDQNTAMAAAARRTRFTTEVLGKSDASGIRWLGETDKHVAMLEHLANTAGEDSELFKAHITQQRALAEQVRSSALFKEAGSGQGGSAGGDVAGKLNAMAQARISDGRAKSYGEAMAQIEREEPALFAEYRAATARRI